MVSLPINTLDAAIYICLSVAVVMGQWRPVLSTDGQQGFRSLPPEVVDYIDRLKRERGL